MVALESSWVGQLLSQSFQTKYTRGTSSEPGMLWERAVNASRFQH